MNELTLEQIISLATNTANIVMSAHANKQCLKREINAEEILEILLKGSIIEQYPTDFPFPSCLMLGFTSKHKPMHVCCAIGIINYGLLQLIIQQKKNGKATTKQERR